MKFNIFLFNFLKTDKLASLNRFWQSNKGTFRASGLAGFEPMPSQSRATGHAFASVHKKKELMKPQNGDTNIISVVICFSIIGVNNFNSFLLLPMHPNGVLSVFYII